MSNQDVILELQKNTKNIRNLCILAHVDHGKTTLADSLLASNGIISTRMAGKLRFMDSREDEQERGITMKSSAVSLIHEYEKSLHLINLIDSPGHVDFSIEVSSAVRLCDGAIILIDVCEGICPQTHAVLRQASIENLKLILVLNKIDRLIVELKMTPQEAYVRLQQILEQINSIVAQQFTSLLVEKLLQQEQDKEELAAEVMDWTDDIDESKLYFSPNYNNVIFASAIDGWGFGIKDFAAIYEAKLGIKRSLLEKTLWGDYYLNTKAKKIMKGAYNKGKKPLFVQLVLDNLWQIYEAVYLKRDTVMTEKIVSSLNIKIPARDLKYSDPKAPLQSLFNLWIPLSRSLLNMVIEYLPSPRDLADEKVLNLICAKTRQFKTLPAETQKLKNDFLQCDASDDKPVVVYISKMFAAEKSSIVKTRRKQLTIEELAKRRELVKQRKELEQNQILTGEHIELKDVPGEKPNEIESKENDNEIYEFLAFARVFSGTVKKGQTLFVLTPKHNPEDFIGQNITIDTPIEVIQKISKHVLKVTLDEIYLMMGRDLEAIDSVPCGNILAIGGLKNIVLKTATLSTSLFCPSFTDMYLQTKPIVRVAIESKNPGQMKEFIEGLKLLNQADPCVEIRLQENGEHILCTAGEVHLQRCIDDLVKHFAKVPVNVSPPRIPFRETIIPPPKFDQVNEKIAPAKELNNDGLIECQSTDKRYTLAVKAKPLPKNVTKLLDESQNLIRLLNKHNESQMAFDDVSKQNILEFKKKLKKEFAESNEGWSDDVVERIWAFGPNKNGPNLLINNVENYIQPSLWMLIEGEDKKASFIAEDNNIIFGFQLITSKGPLCEEPLMGVAFLVEKLKFEFEQAQKEEPEAEGDEIIEIIDNEDEDAIEKESTASIEKGIKKMSFGLSKNQLISLSKEAFKKAFEAKAQRIMVAMYRCEILTVNSEALGKVYAVLGKRNGKILEETLKDNTLMFLIVALLPVAESFGFAEELRKKTGGLASPHLEFSHFEILDIDPAWEPKTEEEYLLYGEKADFENQARKYVDDVRKRKGLFVKKKIVEHSEKQRTLCIK